MEGHQLDGYNPKSLTITHLSGSKNGQAESFSLSEKTEIRLGRSNTSDVVYDPVKDDVVSREHAKISQHTQNPAKFTLEDLGSRNGVYLNGNKIEGSVPLAHGDRVNLGQNGPGFIFSLTPAPPTEGGSQTRILSSFKQEPAAATTGGAPPPSAPRTVGGIGKDTTERMIRDNQKKQATGFYYILGTVVLVLGAAIVYLMLKPNNTEQQPAQKIVTPTEINKINTNRVVFIRAAWKLINPESGREVYHVCDANGKGLFFQMSDNSIEPVLTIDPEIFQGLGMKPVMIAERSGGSGFVVTESGFILTARHVAAGWKAPYNFREECFPGFLIDRSTGDIISNNLPSTALINKWVPAKTKSQSIVKNTDYADSGASDDKGVDGQAMYLEVMFAGIKKELKASVEQISPEHDVAMIKINTPENLEKVEFYDNYDSIAPGNKVYSMGYPAAAPQQIVQTVSKDFFDPQSHPTVVRMPIFDEGTIGQIQRGPGSQMGDVYLITGLNTGPGNSGGPIFDEQGRVIGILNSLLDNNGTRFTFAVPIKYGISLTALNH